MGQGNISINNSSSGALLLGTSGMSGNLNIDGFVKNSDHLNKDHQRHNIGDENYIQGRSPKM